MKKKTINEQYEELIIDGTIAKICCEVKKLPAAKEYTDEEIGTSVKWLVIRRLLWDECKDILKLE